MKFLMGFVIDSATLWVGTIICKLTGMPLMPVLVLGIIVFVVARCLRDLRDTKDN